MGPIHADLTTVGAPYIAFFAMCGLARTARSPLTPGIMPWGLKRFQQEGHLHFVTFSCYRRRPYLAEPGAYATFEQTLEAVRT